MLTDPDKLKAAIDLLEAEEERRINAKIEAGEAVRVPLAIVVGRCAPDVYRAA